MSYSNCTKSQDRSVSIVTGYEVDGRSSIPGRGRYLYLLHDVQTGSEAHSVFYIIGTGGSFVGGKETRA
jgi:hypothetical protein